MTRFADIERFSTNVANIALVDIEGKKRIRDAVIESIVSIATQYNNNPTLRREIDEYAEYMALRDRLRKV